MNTNEEDLIRCHDVNDAIARMRRGVRLRLKEMYHNELFEIRRVEGPDGNKREYVFAFENKKGFPVNDVYDLAWWSESYAEYPRGDTLNMDADEALKSLKEGHRIMKPGGVYFIGKIVGPSVPYELQDVNFVFNVHKGKRPMSENLWLHDPINKFKFSKNGNYGIDD